MQFDKNTTLGCVIGAIMNARSRVRAVLQPEIRAVFRCAGRPCGGDGGICRHPVDLRARLSPVGSNDGAVSRILRPPSDDPASRRWESQGPVRTIILMTALRLLYWCGMSPERLSRFYAAVRRENIRQ